MKYLFAILGLVFVTVALALTPVRATIDCGTLSGYGVVEIELPNSEFRIIKIHCGVRT
jgi:hypothetical protein